MSKTGTELLMASTADELAKLDDAELMAHLLVGYHDSRMHHNPHNGWLNCAEAHAALHQLQSRGGLVGEAAAQATCLISETQPDRKRGFLHCTGPAGRNYFADLANRAARHRRSETRCNTLEGYVPVD